MRNALVVALLVALSAPSAFAKSAFTFKGTIEEPKVEDGVVSFLLTGTLTLYVMASSKEDGQPQNQGLRWPVSRLPVKSEKAYWTIGPHGRHDDTHLVGDIWPEEIMHMNTIMGWGFGPTVTFSDLQVPESFGMKLLYLHFATESEQP